MSLWRMGKGRCEGQKEARNGAGAGEVIHNHHHLSTENGHLSTGRCFEAGFCSFVPQMWGSKPEVGPKRDLRDVEKGLEVVS